MKSQLCVYYTCKILYWYHSLCISWVSQQNLDYLFLHILCFIKYDNSGFLKTLWCCDFSFVIFKMVIFLKLFSWDNETYVINLCCLSVIYLSSLQISLKLNFKLQPSVRKGKGLKALRGKKVSWKQQMNRGERCKVVFLQWKCPEVCSTTKLKHIR